MSTTQDEIVKQLNKRTEKIREDEKQKAAEQERADEKKIAELMKKAVGFKVAETRGGYLFVFKAGAVINQNVAAIYDFWRRSFGIKTPLTIVIADDPAKINLQFRNITPEAFKKNTDELNVLLFKTAEVSTSDVILLRDYTRRRTNRPVLTLSLNNPATDISVKEITQ